ncbi:hypothetical protein [Bifidobacterium catulorum]|uniref:Uncharacterized protein n=1 Tax=Bifidobacterium catulorum TaxID=1630173 RepID=A0A2U2MUD0_9BIFI|nr:hypothetical protein [Bifidobacterium catulorum]PWG60470.1 hypothetical protein DF200_02420 [Bifidobacterium catulorum]
MSGRIQKIENGLAYVNDSGQRVELFRQPGDETPGYPFLCTLQLGIDRGDGPEGPMSMGLARLTKTDLRNIQTVIARILLDRKEAA